MLFICQHFRVYSLFQIRRQNQTTHLLCEKSGCFDCEYNESIHVCYVRQNKNGQSEANKLFLSIHQFFHTLLLGFTDTQRVFQQFGLTGGNRFLFSVFITTNTHQKHFSNTAVHLGRTKGSASHTHKQSFMLLKSERSSRLPDCANLLKYVYRRTDLW